MATYAVGDIHGCFAEFQQLLDTIDFDETVDRLIHVGDLVNGGPDSLATVRWFARRPRIASTVLGNHDLHMLAVAHGCHSMRSKDNFGDLLDADDAGDLIAWLGDQPLVIDLGDRLVVHAGLLPQWTADDAIEAARDIEELLRSSKPSQLFDSMYGNQPAHLDDVSTLEEHWRLTVNALTRMRVLDDRLRLDFSYKSTYADIPPTHDAWFDVDEPAWSTHRIICGHWSALGLRRSERVLALDTGCRWGGQLTAVRLDDDTVHQVDAHRPPTF